jgi:crossover junction endodeoxyribonuclease RuvC
MVILGIDPGLRKTGWGIIKHVNNRLSYLGSGLIKPQRNLPLYARLAQLDDGLARIVNEWRPDEAAIEETFMNNNAASALKLGQARGVCIVSVSRTGCAVSEYAANLVKKSIVGTGHADKAQIGLMVRTLLPKCGKPGEDESDALAIAICHAHHRQTAKRITG